MEELARRLRARATEDASALERRLANARAEIEHYGFFDYVIVNDDFDHAYAELAHIYHAERLRRERNPWLDDFVMELIAQTPEA